MRNWEQLVAERLAKIKLAPEVRQEVIAEIAAHLEECHLELREAGCVDADTQTLDQVRDWATFRRRIRRAKEDPMSFIRRVVLPGAAVVTAALLSLKLLVAWLITPTPCDAGANSCVQVLVSADGPAYLPWLASLLPLGALAAIVARFLGARPVQRVIVAVAPALYLAGEMGFVAVRDGFFWRVPIYWVLIPAVVCALGALPFIGGRHDRIATRAATTA